jgi:hypothetical protein
LRQVGWLFKKIQALPHMFSGISLAGINSRRQESQLVILRRINQCQGQI